MAESAEDLGIEARWSIAVPAINSVPAPLPSGSFRITTDESWEATECGRKAACGRSGATELESWGTTKAYVFRVPGLELIWRV